MIFVWRQSGVVHFLCADFRLALFLCVPSMALNLAVKVRYGGTYQPTISEAQAIRREARSGESV